MVSAPPGGRGVTASAGASPRRLASGAAVRPVVDRWCRRPCRILGSNRTMPRGRARHADFISGIRLLSHCKETIKIPMLRACCVTSSAANVHYSRLSKAVTVVEDRSEGTGAVRPARRTFRLRPPARSGEGRRPTAWLRDGEVRAGLQWLLCGEHRRHPDSARRRRPSSASAVSRFGYLRLMSSSCGTRNCRNRPIFRRNCEQGGISELQSSGITPRRRRCYITGNWMVCPGAPAAPTPRQNI